MKSFLFFILFLGLVGCSTYSIKKLPEIRTGMDKGQVLELVGSPSTSHRKNGTDTWLYKVYSEDKQTHKFHQILFRDGKVYSIGSPKSDTELEKDLSPQLELENSKPKSTEEEDFKEI